MGVGVTAKLVNVVMVGLIIDRVGVTLDVVLEA